MVSGSLQLDFEILPNFFLPTMSGSGYTHYWLQCHAIILDKWLLLFLAECYKRDGISRRRVGQYQLSYGEIRSGSIEINLLTTFLTNRLFATGCRSTGDQSGDDTHAA